MINMGKLEALARKICLSSTLAMIALEMFWISGHTVSPVNAPVTMKRSLESRANWPKRLQAQMKSGRLDLFYTNSMIILFSAFILVCNSSGVHKGAAVWLLHYFIKCPASTALNAHITPLPKSQRRCKEGTVTK